MIACFLSNISAKYYKNTAMLSRVIAKNVGNVFLRHSVYRYHLYVISVRFNDSNALSVDGGGKDKLSQRKGTK